MAPPKGSRPPDQSACAGVTVGRKTAQGKRTARQAQQPPKSARADGSAALASRPLQSVRADGKAASGFARPGPRARRTRKTA
eukprot:9301345-Alexandrium_andersonii.AAC.1